MLLRTMGEPVTLELADGDTLELTALCRQSLTARDYTELSISLRMPPRDLTGAHVIVRGERWRVFGTPPSVTGSPNEFDVTLSARRSIYRYSAELLAPEYEQDEWGVTHTTWAGGVPTKCRLIGGIVSDALEETAGAMLMRREVALELPSGVWDERHTAFRFDGEHYRIMGANLTAESQGEGVLIAGVREVG